MKLWFMLIAAASLVACASNKNKGEDPAVAARNAEFEQGLHALEHEDYATAAQVFNRLLVQKPASEMDLVILYDLGAAHEGMGECAAAGDAYRQVVRSSAGKFSRIESEALFRTSLMYECLNQDVKAITSLLDARKRGKDLAPEVLNAELPARLAAAYARIGNRDKALQYFNLASRGLKQVVSATSRGMQAERIAHTLFLMGRLSPSQKSAQADPMTYLQSVSMQQPYLLQAVELNHKLWSTRAEEDLKTAYENIWKFKIEGVEPQREFYTRALQAINELRRIRMPKSDPREDQIFTLLDRTQNLVQTQLSRVAESNPLTSEAQRREGLHRSGRLIDPAHATSKAMPKKKTPTSDE